MIEPHVTNYTVIGVYLDDPLDPGSYIEWVEAIGPESAVEEAIARDSDRAEAITIAVFEGHHYDVGDTA